MTIRLLPTSGGAVDFTGSRRGLKNSKWRLVVLIAAAPLILIMVYKQFGSLASGELAVSSLLEDHQFEPPFFANENEEDHAAAPSIFVVWMYPSPPATPDFLAPGEALFCAYQVACHALLVPWKRINLRKITFGTKYHKAVMNHALQKVIQGRNYVDHIQSIAMLSLVHGMPTSCARTWGEHTRTICHRDLYQYSSYNPMDRNHVAPLAALPQSQQMHHLHFLSLRYQMGINGNSGDEIQSLAAAQFQPFVSKLVDRDRGWGPSTYGTVINNGWYGNPIYYPVDLLDRVNMTLIAMHFSKKGRTSVKAADQPNLKILQTYTKEVGPIGARDLSTLAFLRRLGIPSFLSLCVTLMLQLGCNCHECPPCTRNGTIVVNDVVSANLPDHVRDQLAGAVHVSPTMRFKRMHDETFARTFEYASNLLEIYAHADLVVTSRLHCALPCLALGIPVIFVDAKKKKNLPGGQRSRLTGIFEILNVYKPGDEWNFDLQKPPPNPGVHIIDRHRASIWNYLKKRSPFFEDTAKLHGMVPLRRLGAGRTSSSADRDIVFHFVAPANYSWHFKRAIESTFFHHPNAKVMVHRPFDAPAMAMLDIFKESGYDLSILQYDTTHPIIPEHHVRDYVGVAALLMHGGVYLSQGLYLTKAIPLDLSDGIVTVGAGGMAIRLQPSHATKSSSTTKHGWPLHEYIKHAGDIALAPSFFDALRKIGSPTAFPQAIPLVQQGESATLGKKAKECVTIDIGLNISSFFAVHLDTKILQHDTMVNGSTCDKILNSFCIFCDEIHTTFPSAF